MFLPAFGTITDHSGSLKVFRKAGYDLVDAGRITADFKLEIGISQINHLGVDYAWTSEAHRFYNTECYTESGAHWQPP